MQLNSPVLSVEPRGEGLAWRYSLCLYLRNLFNYCIESVDFVVTFFVLFLNVTDLFVVV